MLFLELVESKSCGNTININLISTTSKNRKIPETWETLTAAPHVNKTLKDY